MSTDLEYVIPSSPGFQRVVFPDVEQWAAEDVARGEVIPYTPHLQPVIGWGMVRNRVKVLTPFGAHEVYDPNHSAIVGPSGCVISGPFMIRSVELFTACVNILIDRERAKLKAAAAAKAERKRKRKFSMANKFKAPSLDIDDVPLPPADLDDLDFG